MKTTAKKLKEFILANPDLIRFSGVNMDDVPVYFCREELFDLDPKFDFYISIPYERLPEIAVNSGVSHA
jgi:hypothetical protein